MRCGSGLALLVTTDLVVLVPTINQLLWFVNPFPGSLTVDSNHFLGSLVPRFRRLPHFSERFYYVWGMVVTLLGDICSIMGLMKICSSYQVRCAT